MTSRPTSGSMFSGVEGIGLGLEQVGYQPPLWQVEKDPYCLDVLAKNYPNAQQSTDVRFIDGGWPHVDVLTAGFPCQPSSSAGKRLGTADERWLWPEVARVVKLLQPHLLIVENVKDLRARGLVDVLTDLAELGYDAEYDLIPAAAVGAPHLRARVALVAWPSGGQAGRVFHAPPVVHPWWVEHDEVLPRLIRDAPERNHRLRCLGNAVVPQWAAWVGYCAWQAMYDASSDPTIGRRGFPAEAYTRLPAAGRLHRGKVIRLNGTVPHKIKGRLWPTPAADDAEWTVEALAACVHEDGRPAYDPHRRLYHRDTGQIVQRTLTNYARGVEAGLWPTPTLSDAKGSRRSTARTDAWASNEGVTLLDAARTRLWPTPKASPSGQDYARMGRPESGGDDLQTAASRAAGDASAQLNPAWVEWLMGFPAGWTHPGDLELAA